MKLYEITEAQRNIIDLIIENEGELTSPLASQLDMLSVKFDDKIMRTCEVIRTIESQAKAARDEAKRLSDLAKTRTNSVKSLKYYIMSNMIALEKQTVEGDLFKVRIQKNGLPSINWEGDSDNIPDRFRLKPPPELDKIAAKAAWQSVKDQMADLQAAEEVYNFRIQSGQSADDLFELEWKIKALQKKVYSVLPEDIRVTVGQHLRIR